MFSKRQTGGPSSFRNTGYSLIPIHTCFQLTYFCSVATSISAPLPFLYASSVNETTVAWSIMRFIFSCVLCTALPKVWVQATICQNKGNPIFFQYKLFFPVAADCAGGGWRGGGGVINIQQLFWPACAFWSSYNDQSESRENSIVNCVLLKFFLPSLWNSKWCPDECCQHLLELYQVSSSSVMASEKDQVGSEQCDVDLQKGMRQLFAK